MVPHRPWMMNRPHPQQESTLHCFYELQWLFLLILVASSGPACFDIGYVLQLTAVAKAVGL